MVSPDDSFREVQEKALHWIATGATAVLVIDPEERTATVYRGEGEASVQTAEQTLDLGDAVPGFSMPVAALLD